MQFILNEYVISQRNTAHFGYKQSYFIVIQRESPNECLIGTNFVLSIIVILAILTAGFVPPSEFIDIQADVVEVVNDITCALFIEFESPCALAIRLRFLQIIPDANVFTTSYIVVLDNVRGTINVDA